MNRAEAYDFLLRLAEFISVMFGRDCETIIHEMHGAWMKNLAVFNGHVSGRKAGSTLSIYGRDTMADTPDQKGFDLDKDYLNSLVMLRGRKIKSTTIHMRGEDYHYALGINYDFTLSDRMKGVLEELSAVAGNLIDPASDGLQETFDACLETFGIPIENMKKADRQALVQMLRERGVFHIQKSVPWVAEKLGVSKYTIYNYLKELEAES